MINDCTHILYSEFCINSNHLFGCIGIRNGEYRIFNTAYSREEYERLAGKIIEHMRETGEWGKFLSPECARYGYNETLANIQRPLSREEALSRGYLWSDYESPAPDVARVIPADRLPESIDDIPDDILNWAISCEVSGKPFRLTAQELAYLRKRRLPVPRRHPDVRCDERMKNRKRERLFERTDAVTGASVWSSVPPEFPEQVVSHETYRDIMIDTPRPVDISTV